MALLNSAREFVGRDHLGRVVAGVCKVLAMRRGFGGGFRAPHRAAAAVFAAEALDRRLMLSVSPATVYAFTGGSDGFNPDYIVADRAGNLYGTCQYGGANNSGTVWELPKGSSTVTTLASFSADVFDEGVAVDSSGDVFGTSDDGGAGDAGFLWEVAHGSNTVTTVNTFAGSTSVAGVAMDSSGNLFGVTSNDGDNTVWELASGSSSLSTIANFDFDDQLGIAIDSSGNLYGVGGDAIWELTKGSSTPSTLFTFIGPDLAISPYGLAVDGNGNLFGSTYGNDIVWELAKGSGAITTLSSFGGDNQGGDPTGLTFDSSGNLYGACEIGGPGSLKILANGDGTVFELSDAVLSSRPVLQFAQQPSNATTGTAIAPITVDIDDPSGNLLSGDDSSVTLQIATLPVISLSGPTTVAAVNGVATFNNLSIITPGSYTLVVNDGSDVATASTSFAIATAENQALTPIYSFSPDTAGQSVQPDAITADSNGDLFGTTSFTTSDDEDRTIDAYYTLWELPAGAGATTTLYTFQTYLNDAAVGQQPGQITVDSSGNVFGTANENGQSSIWELPKGSTAITTLCSPTGATEADGLGAITVDSGGDLFGASELNGANGFGTVWELPSGNSTISTLYSFPAGPAEAPSAITIDSSGNLFGTTEIYGNDVGIGTIWELAKGSASANVIYSFTGGADGGSPIGIAMDSSGDFYGLVDGFGSNGQIWELAKGTSFANTIYTFSDGIYPSGITIDGAGTLYGNSVNGGAGGYGAVWKLIPGVYPLSNGSTALAFSQGPASTTTGALDTITVDIDSGGTLLTTDDSDVTLTLGGGSSGAMLNGTTTVAAVDGVATFSDLSVTTAGDDYMLTASDGSDTPATSAPFNVTASAVTMPPSSPSPVVPTLGRVSLQPAVVAGAKLDAKVPVLITDQGNALNGVVTVKLYADATTSLDGNQVLVVPPILKHLSLKAGKGKSFTFVVKSLPSTLGNGTYHLLAEVIDPSGLTNVAATTQTVTVAAAFIKPAVMVGAVTPPSIASGKTGSVSVTVFNMGNVPASGIDITLSPSQDGFTPLAGILLRTMSSGAKILPNKSKTFKLHFKAPSALSAGSYFPYVSVMLGAVSTTAVGTQQFTIG